MKRFTYILFSILLCGSVAAGCDFLDVDPDGQVRQEKMFEDVQGYRDAMYGVYATMAGTKLYGANLSYEFADELGQLLYCRFDSNQRVERIQQYRYRDSDIRQTVDAIWGGLYEAISYANNILEHIEKENLDSDPDLRLITGEALAVRAFLHFDVVRYFCDNYADDHNAGGIPYAYTFDLKNKKLYSLQETYVNILNDLTRAEEFLAEDAETPIGSNLRPYTEARYSHAHLYAVYAIKARVYHTMGDLINAAKYANKVIDSGQFALIENPATEMDDAKRYPGGTELIWGLFNNRLYDYLAGLFLENGRYTFKQIVPREDIRTNVFGVTSWPGTDNDYRWRSFFTASEDVPEGGMDVENVVFTRLVKVNIKDPSAVTAEKALTKGICLIRLPEMYFIAAEAAYGSNPEQAKKLLQQVRTSRGMSTEIADGRLDTFEKFRAELLNERRREMYGEGQVFLEHKRQNADLYNISGMASVNRIPASKSIFVLPWPDNEVEFGQSNQ